MAQIKSNDHQLQMLLGFICESVNSKIQINSKLLRDMLDVIEGLMRGAVNSKGNYSHSTLKLKCSYISIEAKKLKKQTNSAMLLRITHREHAVPLKVLVSKLYSLNNIKINELKTFLDKNLISVLITKLEQSRLDNAEFQIKDKMPVDWDETDVFARFKIVNIEITKTD